MSSWQCVLDTLEDSSGKDFLAVWKAYKAFSVVIVVFATMLMITTLWFCSVFIENVQNESIWLSIRKFHSRSFASFRRDNRVTWRFEDRPHVRNVLQW